MRCLLIMAAIAIGNLIGLLGAHGRNQPEVSDAEFPAARRTFHDIPSAYTLPLIPTSNKRRTTSTQQLQRPNWNLKVSQRSDSSGIPLNLEQMPPEVVAYILQGWRLHSARLERMNGANSGTGNPAILSDLSVGLGTEALKEIIADRDKHHYHNLVALSRARLSRVGK